MSKSIDLHQVAPDVFAFTGTDVVNWVIIQEGTDLTLADAGWNGDIQRVERSIRSLGRRPKDLCAVLLAHAHADHTGALNHLHHALPFPDTGRLDLPGRPMSVATHGHTSGHSSFYLPEVGVLLSGDAMVTAHPTFDGVGPRLLPADFSHNQHDVIRALNAFRDLDADTFIPGHGPPWYGPIADSVDQALEKHAAAPCLARLRQRRRNAFVSSGRQRRDT